MELPEVEKASADESRELQLPLVERLEKEAEDGDEDLDPERLPCDDATEPFDEPDVRDEDDEERLLGLS